MKNKKIFNPLVTIITVTLNSEKFIEECISSVLSQDYQNIEYIIIDGKSSDNTLIKILKYKNSIAKIISEKDDGLYDALNKGLKEANGEYVGFLHSDDFFANDYVVSKVVEKFKSADTDFVHSNLIIVNRNNPKKIIRNLKVPNFNLFSLKIGIMPPHPTIYYKRSLCKIVGNYNLNYKIASDYDMLLRMVFIHNCSNSYININSVIMRSGGLSNSSIRSKLMLNKEILKSAKKNKFYTNLLFLFLKIPVRIIEFIK